MFGGRTVASRSFRGIVVALSLRLFSVCPRVSKCMGKLVAATAWRLRILTLGWLYRKVVVDPKGEELTLYRRYFWVFPRRRRVRVGRIGAVEDRAPGLAACAPFSWGPCDGRLFSLWFKAYL